MDEPVSLNVFPDAAPTHWPPMSDRVSIKDGSLNWTTTVSSTDMHSNRDRFVPRMESTS